MQLAVKKVLSLLRKVTKKKQSKLGSVDLFFHFFITIGLSCISRVPIFLPKVYVMLEGHDGWSM